MLTQKLFYRVIDIPLSFSSLTVQVLFTH